MKSSEKIDFVVLWVDGNDPVWRAEKEKWEKKLGIASDKNNDSSDIRYRDYGLLKYWFRGVEKFAPWVNKVHFVTCGQIPDWLNTEHPKLHIVKHSDYMPKDALPTFNSNAIEMMMYKIDGLAEQFVLFNDDTFLTDYVKPKDYFKDGKPVNAMSLCPIFANCRAPYYKTLMNNMEIINRHYDFNNSIRSSLRNYLSVKQGKYIFRTLPLLGYANFPGFANYHVPLAYLRKTFNEVWSKEPEVLMDTVYSRFRNYETDVNHWVFNYWQFAKGDFFQKCMSHERNVSIDDPRISDLIKRQKYRMIGIGDVTVNDFEKTKKELDSSFGTILPERSGFEK